MENITHAFIVRIWHEEDDTDEEVSSWRGSIEHVGEEKRLYFHELEGIIRFIREETGIQTGPPTPWWRALWVRIRHEFSFDRK